MDLTLEELNFLFDIISLRVLYTKSDIERWNNELFDNAIDPIGSNQKREHALKERNNCQLRLKKLSALKHKFKKEIKLYKNQEEVL